MERPSAPENKLTKTLRGLQRAVRIPGMEGEMVPDPVAQQLLSFGKSDIEAVSHFLDEKGIDNPQPLNEGYGTFAIVLDAGDKIVRLSLSNPPARVEAPYVLQPEVNEKIGQVWVQIVKKVDTSGITEQDLVNIQNDLASQGYKWDDPGTDNLGRDELGNLVIIDGTVSR
jgi:hypothetical protein